MFPNNWTYCSPTTEHIAQAGNWTCGPAEGSLDQYSTRGLNQECFKHNRFKNINIIQIPLLKQYYI